MKRTLAIDLGTTNFKACVFDQHGQLTMSASVRTPSDHPYPGWSQIEVANFQRAIKRLIATLGETEADARARVEQITFATQSNSFVLLDQQGQPTTPIIVWNDSRAKGLAHEVKQLAHTPTFSAQTGLKEVGPQSMGAKIRWLQRQNPKSFQRARRLCLISDYLTWWFTGQHVTEVSTVGLTGMVDIHRLTWRGDGIEKFGLDQLALPRIERPGHTVGSIKPPIAHDLGLPDDCRFVLGCLDQYAGAVGVGNVRLGCVSETTGTVLATVALAEQFDPTLAQRDVVQGPAFKPGWYFRMAFGSISANLLEAYRQANIPDWTDEMLSEAAASIPDRTPLALLDPDASLDANHPVFLNHHHEHGPAHDIRAIMVGVAQALGRQLNRVMPNGQIKEVYCAGGAARSRVWLQIKAKQLGIPMVALDCPEPTCYGAALVSNLHYHAIPRDRIPMSIATRAEP